MNYLLDYQSCKRQLGRDSADKSVILRESSHKNRNSSHQEADIIVTGMKMDVCTSWIDVGPCVQVITQNVNAVIKYSYLKMNIAHRSYETYTCRLSLMKNSS